MRRSRRTQRAEYDDGRSDTNGDGDFQIVLVGSHALGLGDFVL
jgi:hypothetical protein